MRPFLFPSTLLVLGLPSSLCSLVFSLLSPHGTKCSCSSSSHTQLPQSQVQIPRGTSLIGPVWSILLQPGDGSHVTKRVWQGPPLTLCWLGQLQIVACELPSLPQSCLLLQPLMKSSIPGREPGVCRTYKEMRKAVTLGRACLLPSTHFSSWGCQMEEVGLPKLVLTVFHTELRRLQVSSGRKGLLAKLQ